MYLLYNLLLLTWVNFLLPSVESSVVTVPEEQHIKLENFEALGLEDNPDIYLDVPELIRKYGYPVEIHTVTTNDGYILTLHRIPHGRNASRGSFDDEFHSVPRTPVFMQHGLLSSSSCWILASPEKAPAYIMADAGYDVWLGNARGNKYSRNHTRLDPSEKEFWQFSWEEMAQYDLPAVIDYVLDATKYSQLYYIGHSMVKAMFGLGPVATTSHIRSPIRYLAPFEKDIDVILRLLGEYEFLPNNPIYIKWAEYICTHYKYEKLMCMNAMFFLAGFDAHQFNMTWLPVILSHGSEGTSTKTLIHYAQEVNSGKFRRYDYGYYGNMKVYHRHTPPSYDLTKVTAPVNLLWASNDWLADPTDVKYLNKHLPNVVFNMKIPLPEFNHIDFIWGIDCDKLVYKRILKYMPYF
uniref:Lipase n=1 Tax=Crangon crangon TaxID=491138 RepID=A0A2Z4C0L7_CRACN|nr:putative triacylglycerol lipase [Crangon crangon]